jgi:hypothetical protein
VADGRRRPHIGELAKVDRRRWWDDVGEEGRGDARVDAAYELDADGVCEFKLERSWVQNSPPMRFLVY